MEVLAEIPIYLILTAIVAGGQGYSQFYFQSNDVYLSVIFGLLWSAVFVNREIVLETAMFLVVYEINLGSCPFHEVPCQSNFLVLVVRPLSIKINCF